MKDKIKNLIFFVLNIFFSFIHPNKASILMYHSIDENEVLFNVKPKDFEKQMEYLKRKNYKIIKLSHLIEKLQKNKTIEQKTIVLTFDDGFKDNYTNAFPVLKKYNFPATIFLATSFIDREMNNSYDRPLPIMRWEDARVMEESGLVEFGSHTHSHPDMINLNIQDFILEIERSINLLNQNLKTPIKIFSYPKGRFKDEQIEYLKKLDFIGSVKTDDGLVGNNNNLFVLNRNFIYSKGGFSQFKGKLCLTVEIFNKVRDLF